MQLPVELSQSIAKNLAGISPSALARAAADLSSTYRGRSENSAPRLDALHRAAYLITRLPATYAVLMRVLEEIKGRVPEVKMETMLDLGAGPGTAMWAAARIFPDLRRVILIEQDDAWIRLGKALAVQSPLESKAEWQQGSLVDPLPPGSFDLVVLSYVLNELPRERRVMVVRSAWERTSGCLVLVEPGTPAGFGDIRELRRELIACGAHLVVPCPHENECPMSGGNWCHFASRLQRTSHHRIAKSAELGYEDEKYSYVVFSRRPVALPNARIVRHPRKHSGHVEVEVCTPQGLERKTISRKQRDRYKHARKADWGDAF